MSGLVLPLCGRRYDIILGEDIEGFCQRPQDLPPIFVKPSLNTRNGMETLLHECLHALCPDAKEKDVDARAKELTAVLWRLGFRRTG